MHRTVLKSRAVATGAGRARQQLGALVAALAILASALALISAPPAGAVDSICDAVAGNAVQNCGFDTGAFTNWTLGGNTSFVLVTAAQKNSGTHSAQVAPAAPHGTLSQSLTVERGTPQTVSFYLWNNVGGTNFFSASISGVAIGGGLGTKTLVSQTDQGAHGFTQFSFQVLPLLASVTLTFEYSNENGIFLIDDVSVSPAGPAPTSEVAVYRPSNSVWYLHDGPQFINWGTTGDIAVPGDYNGDSQLDVAVWRPSNGAWYVKDGAAMAFGTLGDVPVPADYDGDGDDDFAVVRSSSTWIIDGSPPAFWGTVGDVPAPADYDGDGDDDVAVYRPSTGTWYILNQASVSLGGTPGDIPVPADYDGDGDDEPSVFRSSTGEWLLQNGPPGSFWGKNGDIPVPGDYDGDGDDQRAVFRPSSGLWYILEGTGEYVAWGTDGDDPLPLPAAVRDVYFP